MDIAATGAIERIARVLAGQHLSRNADGDEAHAAARVDATWQEHRDDAIAILKTLREPDADMERAGDIAVWQRMIAATLGDGGEASGSSEDRSAAPADPRGVT